LSGRISAEADPKNRFPENINSISLSTRGLTPINIVISSLCSSLIMFIVFREA
jgi:hypothetical protein